MKNVLLAMHEKLDWKQTNIAVDIAIRKEGKVLDSEAFVSDIYSFHFQGMHELLTPLYFVVKKAIVVTKEAIREEAKSFRRRPIVNLQ